MLQAIEALGALPDPVREAAAPLFFSPEVKSRRPELLQAFDAKLRAWDRQRLADSVAPLGRIIFGRRAAMDDMAKLSMPTLVMTGTDDVARTPAEGREMARRIGCPFQDIPDAGHISSLEAPEFVNQALATFLAPHAA
jgi:pimeloyl-ACP methyl ester carboxylesterase